MSVITKKAERLRDLKIKKEKKYHECIKEANQVLTLDQEYMLVYEALLDSASQLESANEILAEYSEAIASELMDFEEQFPEIVSEYKFQLLNKVKD